MHYVTPVWFNSNLKHGRQKTKRLLQNKTDLLMRRTTPSRLRQVSTLFFSRSSSANSSSHGLGRRPWSSSLEETRRRRSDPIRTLEDVQTLLSQTFGDEEQILTAGLKRGGGVRSFLASHERFLTTLLWMAQLTQ